nr:hypothetical protein 52 [Balneolaceae bacterium]
MIKIANLSNRQLANKLDALTVNSVNAARRIFAEAIRKDEEFAEILYRLGEEDPLVQDYRKAEAVRLIAKEEAARRVGPLPEDLTNTLVARLREKGQVVHA